jgi:hypothetical protein
MDTASQLEKIRDDMRALATRLPSPTDAMLEFEEPQDVGTEMRGVLEHSIQEHLEPVIDALREAATATGKSLEADFRRYAELIATTEAELLAGCSGRLRGGQLSG